MYQRSHPKSPKSSSPNEGCRERWAWLPSAKCQPVLWNSHCSCQALGISREKWSSFQEARVQKDKCYATKGGRQDTLLISIIHRNPSTTLWHRRHPANGMNTSRGRLNGEGCL